MDITTVIVSGLFGIFAAIITSIITIRANLRGENRKWQRELIQKVNELKFSNPQQAEDLISKYAVGLLIVVSPSDSTKQSMRRTKFLLPPTGQFVIGRSDPKTGLNVDIDLSPYKGISRQHAMIRMIDEKAFITSLTRNTVRINGKAVATNSKEFMQDGDVLEIGNVELIYYKLN